MKDLLMITYTSALPIVLGYIVWLLKTQINAKSAEKVALMFMLRMMLVALRDRYVDKGSVTKQEYDDYMEVYELYHDKFNGNGLGTRMMEDVNKLDIVG